MQSIRSFARSARPGDDNPKPRNKTKEATIVKTIITSLAAILVAFSPSIASAQPADADPPATPPATTSTATPATPPAPAARQSNPDIMPVASHEELSELDHYVGRYYYLTVQKNYVENQAKPAVKEIVGEGPRYTRFTNLFKGFQIILAGPGDKVPAKTNSAMMAFLDSKQCTIADGKGSDGCKALWPKVKKVAEDTIAACPNADSNDFCHNAQKMLETATEYAEIKGTPTDTAHVGIILAHGAIARATMQAPEDERPWVLPTGGLVDMNGCILYKDDSVPKHCGKVTKANEADGITVESEDGTVKTVTPQEIADGDAAFVVGTPANVQSVKGKGVCVLEKDKDPSCETVKDADEDGVTLDSGRVVKWDDIYKTDGPGLYFGDQGRIKELEQRLLDAIETYADKRHWEVGIRVPVRMGYAEGYEDFTSQYGVLAVGRYNIHDNVAFQLGVGVGRLTGTSEIGTVENDSSTMLMGLAGARFHIGPRDSWFAGVAELNFTWQGLGPGVEAGGGFKFTPMEGFDIDVMGMIGAYETNLTTFTNVDGRETPSHFLLGGGPVLGASYAW